MNKEKTMNTKNIIKWVKTFRAGTLWNIKQEIQHLEYLTTEGWDEELDNLAADDDYGVETRDAAYGGIRDELGHNLTLLRDYKAAYEQHKRIIKRQEQWIKKTMNSKP